ncbi:alpha/beta hydrolase [Pseudanabaena sp. FACHB-2040]|uniref:alpha/beta hydrolase n=1 Tax=Pseudanabaena sp. FACHB-2040 TaxID=2692859 RepID=UPI001683611A|nr:alpha/beta hydrolase [Pseudanabaena sp. FACHB-2040]MBD2259611.1 alpha/beta hydrolase [Pseudanabaena sp. FACHB-2040]
MSAERIVFAVGPLLQSISVESLTTFALEGELTGDLARYAPFIGDEQLQEFRAVLTQAYPIDSLTIGNLSYTPLGSSFLQRLGNIFQTETGNNGFRAIRASLIATAQAPEGFTVLGFLQNYPTNMRLNTREALFFMQALAVFREYRESALAAIATQSNQEAAAAAPSSWRDLSQPGPYRPQRQQLTVTSADSFPADLYLPEGAPSPLPVVAIAPSQGATLNEYESLANGLASYGMAVVIANPPRTAATGRTALENRLNAELSPADFLNQPRNITATLDFLETWETTQPTLDLNLEQVGIIGDYVGGYTALAVAGANISRSRLDTVCSADGYVLNLSLLLQCQALELPTTDATLLDPRIGAVVAINPLASAIFGPEEVGNIEVPVLLIGGTDDLLTPAISEQIHPFLWLNSPDKFLALQTAAQPADASSSAGGLVLLPGLTEANSSLAAAYTRALSLAFMQRFIAQQSDYEPYLSATYGQYLSEEPLDLLILQDLSLEQLESAYGSTAPVDVLPELRMR